MTLDGDQVPMDALDHARALMAGIEAHPNDRAALDAVRDVLTRMDESGRRGPDPLDHLGGAPGSPIPAALAGAGLAARGQGGAPHRTWRRRQVPPGPAARGGHRQRRGTGRRLDRHTGHGHPATGGSLQIRRGLRGLRQLGGRAGGDLQAPGAGLRGRSALGDAGPAPGPAPGGHGRHGPHLGAGRRPPHIDHRRDHPGRAEAPAPLRGGTGPGCSSWTPWPRPTPATRTREAWSGPSSRTGTPGAGPTTARSSWWPTLPRAAPPSPDRPTGRARSGPCGCWSRTNAGRRRVTTTP